MTDPLADLERRYDGPIPPEEWAVARAGGRLPLALRRARRDLRVYRGLIHNTIKGIQVSRYRDGDSVYGEQRQRELLAALNWYRAERLKVLRHLICLQRQQAAERQNAAGIDTDMIAPLRRTVARQAAERKAIRPVTHSMGTLMTDKAVAAACQAPEEL